MSAPGSRSPGARARGTRRDPSKATNSAAAASYRARTNAMRPPLTPAAAGDDTENDSTLTGVPLAWPRGGGGGASSGPVSSRSPTSGPYLGVVVANGRASAKGDAGTGPVGSDSPYDGCPAKEADTRRGGIGSASLPRVADRRRSDRDVRRAGGATESGGAVGSAGARRTAVDAPRQRLRRGPWQQRRQATGGGAAACAISSCKSSAAVVPGTALARTRHRRRARAGHNGGGIAAELGLKRSPSPPCMRPAEAASAAGTARPRGGGANGAQRGGRQWPVERLVLGGVRVERAATRAATLAARGAIGAE